MANGYFERGEIYMIRMDGGSGGEIGAFRPGVIISNNTGNNASSVVVVAMLTSQGRDHVTCPKVLSSGREAHVVCNQIFSVDKRKINRYLGRLTMAEQEAVDNALDIELSLGTGLGDDLAQKDKEIAALNAQISELKNQIGKEASETHSAFLRMRIERDMWKETYGKAVDLMAQMQLGKDFPGDDEAVDPVTPKNSDPQKIDINTCTITELRNVGLSPVLSKTICDKRPYSKVEDLIGLPGLTSIQYQILKNKIVCVPMKKEEPVHEHKHTQASPKKININTATAKEINEELGIFMSAAYSITGRRNRKGKYQNVEELLEANGVSKHMLDRIRDRIEL